MIKSQSTARNMKAHLAWMPAILYPNGKGGYAPLNVHGFLIGETQQKRIPKDWVIEAVRPSTNESHKPIIEIVRKTNCPFIVVEPLYFSNDSDFEKIDIPLISTAIFEGCLAFISWLNR